MALAARCLACLMAAGNGRLAAHAAAHTDADESAGSRAPLYAARCLGRRGARRKGRALSHSRAAAAQQSGRAAQAPPMPAVIPGLARCSPLRRFAR